MLVLLDNAHDVEQVRPLLPGACGSLVIVTSRNRLTGLIVAEHAQPLTLGLLSADEARELLAGRLGAARMAEEHEAAQEIIDRCTGLPLALSVVAARAASQPTFPLATLAAELSHTGSLYGDPDTDVRAVFSWSYHRLGAAAARLFRLLGLHPGRDTGVLAAAALMGTDVGSAASALNELATVHLLTEHMPGRFSCHDLLRAYGAQLAHRLDDEPQRRAAQRRLTDYHLRSAYAAAMQLAPARRPITPPPSRPAVAAETFNGYQQAFSWFVDEHHALLATIGLTQDRYVWQLAWALADYLDRRGHWHDGVTTHHAALEAARRLADRSAEAYAHRGIGCAHDRLGRYDDARGHLEQALVAYRDLGDNAGEAQTQLNLAALCERQGLYPESLDHVQEAFRLFQAADDQAGQANSLNGMGWSQARLGNHADALLFCRQALALHEKTGDRLGMANTLDTLGYVHHGLGDHEAASAAYRRALEIYRALGNRYYEAVALSHIGDSELAAGRVRAARGVWSRALSILDPLDRADTDQVATRRDCPDAALVRAKLRESGGDCGPDAR
jgi:tetratricopeptide (TPR) repeat protein